MKNLLALSILMTAMPSIANIPSHFLGEYRHCQDLEGNTIDAYVNLVDFADEGLGFQVALWPRTNSMILQLDKELRYSTERISGQGFEYSGSYTMDQVLINFSQAGAAHRLGFEQNTVLDYSPEERSIAVTFEDTPFICFK